MTLKVLVIGGVACGPKTAARLKRLCPGADITMIDKGSIVSYGSCGLPYFVEGLFPDIEELINTPAGVPRDAVFFDKVKGFKVLIQTEALSIDRKNKTVRVRYSESGKEENLSYDKLVLATGGYAFRPPIPGIDLKNVWSMTHPDHADSLKREIKAQGLKKAVLVGAGFINIEMAEALIRQGLNVTIVEMFDQIMPGVLDKDIAMFAAKYLKEKGIKLVLGESVKAIDGKDKVSGVVTDKQRIDADLAVIAVGTRPNDKLAKEAGLMCMEKGGIIINAYGQTSDKDIYAGGDCALNQYMNGLMGSPMFVPMGSTANKHGRIIANHIAGLRTPFKGITCTAIVKAFAYSVGRTGIGEKQAKDLGLDVEIFTWAGPDMPHYMPESNPFIIKMIASRKDRKLIGVQTAGYGNCSKRLDVAASVISFGGTLEDLADIDFGYAPPYAPPIDPLATCAQMLSNKLDGIAKGISALEAKSLIDAGKAILLDVRTDDEFEAVTMPYKNVVHIPTDELRSRAGELPKDKDILAYCKVSMRGYEAQLILNSIGFQNVRFIEGGITGWLF